MTPRQVKRLRKKILSEPWLYYKRRLIESGETKGAYEAEQLLYYSLSLARRADTTSICAVNTTRGYCGT